MLGRFIQPDTITPGGPQGLNRYSYVGNQPINFNDPTGHEQGSYCDRGYCDTNGNVIMVSPSGGGGGDEPEDKPGCGVNGKGPYGFHCTAKDLDGATMEERLDWFRWLTGTMDGNIGAGTSDWFNNIDTVVSSFVWSGQDDNGWMLTVDANILVAVQDGYATYLGYGGALGGGTGKDLWNKFFIALGDQKKSEDSLIAMWGAAEQAGTDAGLARATELGYGGGTWSRLNWITTDYGIDDFVFTKIGNMYRGSSKGVCALMTCVGGFFDPRTKLGPISPVGVPAAIVYYYDAMGQLIMGH